MVLFPRVVKESRGGRHRNNVPASTAAFEVVTIQTNDNEYKSLLLYDKTAFNYCSPWGEWKDENVAAVGKLGESVQGALQNLMRELMQGLAKKLEGGGVVAHDGWIDEDLL